MVKTIDLRKLSAVSLEKRKSGLLHQMQAPTGLIRASFVTQYLRSFAATIPGGTSEIQRNIIGERVLGLPREPK